MSITKEELDLLSEEALKKYMATLPISGLPGPGSLFEAGFQAGYLEAKEHYEDLLREWMEQL